MVIVWALSWWYGAGFKARALLVYERLVRTYDYFSIDLLAKTLFAPFRQISAGSVRGPLAVKWRAFVDKLISRMIGGMIRLVVMVIGCVWLGVLSLMGFVVLVGWLLVPILPVIGFVAMISGWVPAWN